MEIYYEAVQSWNIFMYILGQHPVVWQKSYKAVVEMAEIDEPEIQMP